MRIVIFGANGPTGRLLTRLSLTAGYDTVAVTRQPGAFGMQDPRLRVAGADVLDADAVDTVVTGSDAVLSALGVPFGKTPVEVYSRGAGWRTWSPAATRTGRSRGPAGSTNCRR